MADKAEELFTLNEIAKEVGHNYGDTSTPSITRAKRYINRALIRLNSLGPWPFLDDLKTFSTVANTGIYSISRAFSKIRGLHIRDDNDRKLIKIDKAQLRIAEPDPDDSTSTPLYYLPVGFKNGSWRFRLHPVPDAAYTIYVDGDLRIPLFIDGEDDIREVCNMPDEMVEVVIDLASALMDRKNDDALYRQNLADAMTHAEMVRAMMDSNVDDEMLSREYGEEIDITTGDPRLPPEYGR